MSRQLPLHPSAPDDYPALLTGIDAWQAQAQARHPDVIPCRAGCSACCHGPFDISAADALLVRDAVRGLPPGIRAEVRRKAEAQVGGMQRIEPELAAPWDITRLGEEAFDGLVEAFAEAPCPALDDAGTCRIYQQRPMICRMMGLGLETPDGHVIENACPIQGEFPEYESLEPQRFDLDGWEDAEAEALVHAALALFGSADESGYETTVAGAILLDGPDTVS
ncbi:MAG TPA: YkgJ family cysteine cluster protein [Gemmatimonadales bacterium]|nr:YkgJ family cysteine cluster protein [Gemmatimonadales bacterium]